MCNIKTGDQDNTIVVTSDNLIHQITIDGHKLIKSDFVLKVGTHEHYRLLHDEYGE